jgi:hypothetical protein
LIGENSFIEGYAGVDMIWSLCVTLWIFVGITLAGFIYGPFHAYFPDRIETKKLRVFAVLCGITMGPYILFPIALFYAEWWQSVGQRILWRSPLQKK